MALNDGETYSCPNPDCAAEIRVIRGAKPSCTKADAPRCCCGSEMMLHQVAATGTEG